MVAEVVRVPAWAEYGWLRHGFGTRLGGVSAVYGAGVHGNGTLNVGWTKEDDPAAVAENRRLLVAAVGGEGEVVAVRQVHGVDVRVVRAGDGPFADERGRAVLEGDGLTTDMPGVMLGIQTADCVPVMLVDVRLRAVAVLHAGWRGTAAGMAGVGVARMREEFGSRVEDLVAAVGPSIGACCYAVGEEVRAAFAARFGYASELFTGGRLDLWKANRRQLVEAGVAAERVSVVGECTGCSVNEVGERKYFSHRMEHGFTGRMMSLVGVVE